MARLNKEALIRRAMDSIAADGWTVTPLTKGGTHPARFTMESEGVRHTVRLYIWNLSHGGKSRSASEFRIQVTGIDGFEPEPGGRTLILGWSDDFGVFAGFDVQHRLGKLGASPSIQITAATLKSAGADGGALQDKTKGEWAVALRPDKLGRYAQHLSTVHSGKLDPILAPDDSPAADPLASEIAHLARDSTEFNLDAPEEADLRTDLIAGVDEVLAALNTGKQDPPAGMGHNQPPGPIDKHPGLAPEIEVAAQELKADLSLGKPDPREIGRAGAFLAWAGKILQMAKQEGAKVLDKGKDMAREYMAKALWGTTATLGVTFKEELVEMLRHLAKGILNWLQQISIL
ncbi:hypothetical protein [Sphingosinicella sp. CPCC 101087]|uniref:hypothetical protein n=1 Tax=Sphingosinicella sp. CPCC 101087 TaxID=2497754 RepID=UPI00101C4882|nr:hypothetical protein [Sphingosinicella sp. CPCC 101087]